MVVDNRIHQILHAISHNPSITGVELEAQFGLTRKQLSYSLKKVNDYLESNQLEPIRRFKTGRLAISKPVIDKFYQIGQAVVTNERYIYSEDERINLIILYLLIRTEKLSLIHLSSSLMVSQNTIINDLKKVQTIIEQNELQVNYNRENGYRIIGKEINKRYVLLEIIRKITAMPIAQKIFLENSTITKQSLERVGQIFSEIEKKLKILFTDAQLQELIYFICLILHRIETGKVITELPENYAEVAESREFKLMQKLIELFGVTQQQEKIFLTILIQSSNIQTIADKYFHLDSVLLESVVAVIENFEQISCITFKDKNELIERIYQHWKPAYYRIRYHLSNVNSVYDIVLQEFGHLHEIVRRSIIPFEKLLHCKMPDEEAAFITVLFGGWLTREGVINQIKTKKIAIVVCENSATVSTYLYLTLQVLFPELHFAAAISKREFEKYHRYYDIVFSTGYVNTNKLLFTVNPSLNNFHKNVFRSQVMGALQGVDPSIIHVEELMQIIEKHAQIKDKKVLQNELTRYLYHDIEHSKQTIEKSVPALLDLMLLQHISVLDHVNITWQEAINLAAKPLLAKQYIEPCYVEQMIHKIEFDQPYIMLVDGLIIAHAGINDGVNQIGMSLLKLPQRIDIDGYMQADLIVVLATNNPQQHLKALAQLNDFLEFHNGAQHIRAAKTQHEIYHLFANYQ